MQPIATSQALLPLEKVDNAEKTSFLSWVKALGAQLNLDLAIDEKVLEGKKPKEQALAVTQREQSPNRADETFILELGSRKKALNGYRSGDLMAIIPEGSNKERLYSMSVDRQKRRITLSVRKHEFGLCSSYLSSLEPGENLKATFRNNEAFHYPEEAPGVIMIGNGTGIAPFLGMIHDNNLQKPIRLYWGGQNQDSYGLYQQRIENYQSEGKLQSLHLAFSREGKRQYVQDLIQEHTKEVVQLLATDHVIMLCGGLAMQEGVEAVLDQSCRNILDQPLARFKERGLIKADCY